MPETTVRESMSRRMNLMRFFLILYIVQHHTFLACRWPDMLIPLLNGTGVVYVFFFASGYFLTWRLKAQEQPDYPVLLKKKFLTIALPYLLWNLLIFVPRYLAPLLGGRIPFLPGQEGGLQPFWSSLGDALGITSRFPADGPLWFLRNLFVFFVISPVLLK